MKGTKRWLAALLSAVLLMSLLPAAALAEGDKLSDGTAVTSTANITRAQLAEMIYNKFYPGQTAGDQDFEDIGDGTGGEGQPCTAAQWKAINVLAAKGVLSGTSPTTFGPGGQVTRAEAAVVFWRATGSKSNPTQVVDVYSDINSTAWYAGAVQALTAAGILTGTGEGLFEPYAPATVMMVNSLLGRCDTANFAGFGTGVTRLEMLMEAYEKYRDSPLATVTASEVPYDDIGSCTEIEKEAIQFFTTRGVVSGENPDNTGGRRLFSPYAAASNLQVAMFLYKCAVKFEPESTTDLALHAENGTLSSVAVSYAIPENAQALVDAAWAYLEQEIGTEALSIYRSSPDVPAAEGTVISLSEALTPEEPTFTPDSDTQPTSVTLSAEGGAAIYYTVTTDGSDPAAPTVNSTRYTGPISITENTTIKAVAVKNSLYSGSVAYTVGESGLARVYPVTIIGPTGDMDSYVDLYEDGTVHQIQGSETTLFDPRTNPDTTIQKKLRYWIYNGWMFTAEKDGETENYGPTKVIDSALKVFLNPKIKEGGWTLTMNSKSCGYYDYPDSSSSSSGNKTETTTNPDGSTTTTVTKPNGTVTETTKNPDGSSEVVETQKDGTTTTTTTDTDGNKREVVEKTDGSSQTTVTNTDGTSSTTTVSADGQVEAQVKLPAAVVHDAAQQSEAVALPMPGVPVTSDRETAPTVTVSFTGSTSAKVEIPVANVTAGTVAILVQADGTEQVIKASVTTEDGVSLTVESGVTVKIVDNAKDFADVPATYWASDAIDFATSRELFAGTSESTFTPGAPMTRVMIVTVLARYASDAPAAVIGYAEGQQWAVEAGISDGSNMSGTVTRQQMAAMLYRYAGSPAVTDSLSGFPDAADVSDYAVDAMTWAVENGLITGMTDGTLNPYGWATRAQVATILQRFMVSLAE